ncbi:unnamed protein product, partial [Trichobilharzia regenti]
MLATVSCRGRLCLGHNNSTEWNFDTVGRISGGGGGVGGADSDEDSDESDYQAVTGTTDRPSNMLQPRGSTSGGFDFPPELLTQTNASTAVHGSSPSAVAAAAAAIAGGAAAVVGGGAGGITPNALGTENYNIG